MRFKDEKHFGLRIDADTLIKFRIASDYEGRSANTQIVILMRDFIKAYEAKTGKISESVLEEYK